MDRLVEEDWEEDACDVRILTEYRGSEEER
jgi:hypothetical protein